MAGQTEVAASRWPATAEVLPLEAGIYFVTVRKNPEHTADDLETESGFVKVPSSRKTQRIWMTEGLNPPFGFRGAWTPWDSAEVEWYAEGGMKGKVKNQRTLFYKIAPIADVEFDATELSETQWEMSEEFFQEAAEAFKDALCKFVDEKVRAMCAYISIDEKVKIASDIKTRVLKYFHERESACDRRRMILKKKMEKIWAKQTQAEPKTPKKRRLTASTHSAA